MTHYSHIDERPWIWIDDERVPPTNFRGTDDWAKTSIEAINKMTARMESGTTYFAVWFDHDLGYNYEDGSSLIDGGQRSDTTRPVLLWMIEHNFWPDFIMIHSHNPIGAKWLKDMAERYAPKECIVVREPYKP